MYAEYTIAAHRAQGGKGARCTPETYTTKQLAARIGVHVNTIRFYEEMGFLTAPARRPNGYRIYTDLHLAQCRLLRLAMRAEVMQNGLRKQAIRIVTLCAACRFEEAISAAETYRLMLLDELTRAKAAAAFVEGMLPAREDAAQPLLSRRETARLLCVTPETLRTWERSGLLGEAQYQSGRRVYSAADRERLNIIRVLRSADYSLTAILRLLHGIDSHTVASVESALNTPAPGEDILSVCDRLMLSLQSTLADADELLLMLAEMQKKSQTLQ